LAWSVVLFIIASAAFGGFSTYDYSLRCTRCLREYSVIESRFWGLTYWKTEKLIFAGYDLSKFTDIPDEHIYRKGGFGEETYSILSVLMDDGMTAEGALFNPRFRALKDAFELYNRFPNQELMRETMSFADECLPPDATIDFLHDPRHQKTTFLSVLQISLDNAKSEQDWKDSLENAKSLLASDEAVQK